jgi:nucleoside-diphosphate-sugar epimerase
VRITVFGASGKTGRRVAELALRHGHDVVAFVRDPARLAVPDDPRLTVVTGDVMDAAVVAGAISGSDAVYSEGGANILAGMGEHGVSRIVAVTSQGAGDDRSGLPMALRLFVISAMKSVIDDMNRLEHELAESDTEWTVVRPGGLSDADASPTPRVVAGNFVPGGSRTSRATVAEFIVGELEEPAHIRAAVAISD